MAFLGFDDDKTPTTPDPCPTCGDTLVRVKDGCLPPLSKEDADDRRRCEATRTRIGGFLYCARMRTVVAVTQL